jgi:hypothetical protein
MRSGDCMLNTYMRIASTHNLLDRILSQATWAALRSDAAIKAHSRPPRDSASRHPCLQAASFLPCASQPPDVCRVYLARSRQRLGQGSSHHSIFVTTSSGFETMASCSQDTEDEITEADNTAGDATFGSAPTRGTRGPRQVTPPSMPADLRTALAMPTTFGPNLFEITALHVVSTTCKVKVKDTGDLLLLRDWLFEELGPPYMWTVMLSVVEWEHLTDYQTELHRTMRESWLSSYSKASHTVLQHWLWRFLKKQTESFAPLHKVFAKIKVDSPDSGTSAWTEIFLLYPVIGASIDHKLLARGLKTCLGFKNDSMASALDYITSVNASASQLSHVQPMTVQDVYALVTLMGLPLRSLRPSESVQRASRPHQRRSRPHD